MTMQSMGVLADDDDDSWGSWHAEGRRSRSRSLNRADDDDDSWGSWHHDGRRSFIEVRSTCSSRSEKVVGLVPLASVKGSVGLQQRRMPMPPARSQ